jgi:hypothetical protein
MRTLEYNLNPVEKRTVDAVDNEFEAVLNASDDVPETRTLAYTDAEIWSNKLRDPVVKAKAVASNKACDAKIDAAEAKGAEVLRARGIEPGFTTREHAAAIKKLEAVSEEPVLSNEEWLAAARKRCEEIELELRASSHTCASAEATADGYTVRTRPA